MECDDDPQSSESSDSEDLDDNENNEKELANISFYQKQIEKNELNYEAHLGLIKAFRTMGELEKLRDARKSMNKIYPLSPDLWMEWLSDEQKICTTDEERKYIIDLFEKAVKEYISVKVWVEYIMFMVGGGKVEETRKVYEDALTAVGIHMSEGILVWQTIILVESQIFLGLDAETEAKEAQEQRKRIQTLYRRQARVPLMNVDKAEFMGEAGKWFEDKVDPQVKRDLDNSYKKMMQKFPFEEALLRASDDTEKLEAYRKYINFVRKNDNPAVIQNIYERTVTDLCLNAGIWEEYVRFVMDQFSFADYVILPVCQRSQLNCPWSSALFELHITALQMFEEVIGAEGVKERILVATKDTLVTAVANETEITRIWMSFLVYFRRRISRQQVGCVDDKADTTDKADNANDLTPVEEFRDACWQALTFMDENLDEKRQGDQECVLARFQARVEADSCRDMEAARVIWNERVMKRNNNFKVAALWMEFIGLERCYGTEKHCRKLYRRALERVWDQVELIGSAYLQFEQEVGTLETMVDFEKRYKDRLSIVQKRRQEEAMKEESKKGQGEKGNKGGGNKGNDAGSSKGGSYKGGGNKGAEAGSGANKAATNKIVKQISPLKADEPVPMSNVASVPKGTKRPLPDLDIPPPGYKKKAADEEMDAKKQKVSDEQQREHGKSIEHDSSLDYRSVFLSNMDYNATEADVVEILSECGVVEGFRIAQDFKGRSKGFGYLVFKDPASVPAALKKDRTPVGTRPLFVSRCNPKSREPAFKFSTGLEREKLFVRGLPFSLNEAQVKKVFEPHGEIKSIRLVTHRNGHSKGTCYIEYHDAATAKKVLEKMDGEILDEYKISVFISNPTAKGKSEPPFSSFSSTFVSTSSSRPTGGQRTQLSLVPRAIIRKTESSLQSKRNEPPTSSNGNSNESPQNESPQNESPQNESPLNGSSEKTTPKSNEEFRKLFLK